MFFTVWTYIRRSPYQALATFLALTLSFFVVSRAILALFVSETTLRYFESKPQLILFLKDSVKENEGEKIASKLKNDPLVSSIEYLSKEDALSSYKKQFKNDPLLLEMVTASVLPASIEISSYKIEDIKKIAASFKNDPAVEEVKYQKDVIENLSSFAKKVRRTSIEYIIMHGILTIFIIFLVLSMKIASKKEEIAILKLLGATNSYIRLPFILEGMIYGFVSSLLAGISFLLLIYFKQESLLSIINQFNFVSLDSSMYLLYFLSLVVGGLISGWLSSFISVLRFLK